MREQVLFVLGGSLYRCQNCEIRHARLHKWTISLGDPREDNMPYVVAAAIFGGLVACVAVAIWTLRHAHRWPF